MNSIFIEGVCGTGKSTSLAMLSKKLPAFMLPELPEFNRGLLFPFDSESNIQNNFKSYLLHESIRESLFSALANKGIDYVISDRSYISIFALAISMKDFLGNKFVNIILEEIIKRIELSDYHVPDKIIVLKASYNSIYHRNISKSKNLDSIWFSEQRIKPQILFYNYLIESSLALSISTDQDMKKSIEICEEICRDPNDVIVKEKLINGLQRFQQMWKRGNFNFNSSSSI